MRFAARDGIALPAALLALVVIGALVTGGVYASMLESQSSGSMDYGETAFAAAERGLDDMLGTKNRIFFEDSVGDVGTDTTLAPVTVSLGDVDARYTLRVQRLATLLFQVVSEGEVLSGGRYAGSKRQIAQLVRIHHTYVPKDRAITTQQPLTIRGKSGINGIDSIPANWNDPHCQDMGSRIGVVASETDDITVTGAGGIQGTPDKVENATLDLDSFETYGDMQLDDLREYADITLTPSGSNYNGVGPLTDGTGQCDKSQPLNWGDPNDPNSPCHDYWPIIHVPGDLHASGGYGQGILIVDGDLHLTGSFEFTGLIFVTGSFTGSGNGNKVSGSLNIAGASVTSSDIGKPQQGSGQGNTQIRLNSCAIERAHRYNERFSRPIPVFERSFVDLSALGAT